MARILIADDAVIMRKNLKVILTHAGHTVVSEASNGAQAYEEYQKYLPDLVTLDINMPVVNGMDCMKMILKDFPEAKIIVISSAYNNYVILDAIQGGAKNYIIKPFMVEKVITVINQVLQIQDKISSDTVSNIYKNMGETMQPPAGKLGTPSAGMVVQDIPSEVYNVPDETVKGNEPQFSIEIRSNTFVISINESIDDAGFDKLYKAIQGFLLVKPLKLVFCLPDTEEIDSSYLDKLVIYMNSIEDVDGTVSVVTQKETVMQYLKNKGIGWFTSFYSHLSHVKYL